jgi:hypothetical protein
MSDPELDTMAILAAEIEKLDGPARARVLLWLVRRHQSSGDAIDLRALEIQSRGQPDNDCV